MAGAGCRHLTVALLVSVALAGCVESGRPVSATGADATANAAATASSARRPDRDVEAPEVFQVTSQGLWDGRPSLGGVWVATADAKDPERVLIRNTANGKSVVGALFRRERENPGPPIQISSDAAAALGLLAGQPVEVKVTALRRDDPPAAAADAAEPTLDASGAVASETPAATAVAATTEKADPAKSADAAPAAAEPPPKTRWWQRKAKAEAPAGDAEALGTAGATAAAAVSTAPLAAPPPAAATAPKVASSPTTGGKSLIQLGIFSIEANAKRAADRVIKAGSPAAVRKETSNGKPYWSVVAGPVGTPAERDALMKKVKGLGFSDAYFVSR
jgi:hypothetical protein